MQQSNTYKNLASLFCFANIGIYFESTKKLKNKKAILIKNKMESNSPMEYEYSLRSTRDSPMEFVRIPLWRLSAVRMVESPIKKEGNRTCS